MFRIAWLHGGMKKYLCHTWQGEVVWTLDGDRALVLPEKAAFAMEEALAFVLPKAVNNTLLEFVPVARLEMDERFHMENIPHA